MENKKRTSLFLIRVHDNLAMKVVIVMHRTNDDDVYVNWR